MPLLKNNAGWWHQYKFLLPFWLCIQHKLIHPRYLRVWGTVYLGYYGFVKGTKTLFTKWWLPNPQFHCWFRCSVGNDILSVQTSICKDDWFILTVRMVVSLSELYEALESLERGAFTNIVRHMAHKHITAHLCTHIHKHSSHLPTWYKRKSDESTPRCQGKSHIRRGTVWVSVCFHVCAPHRRPHLSLWHDEHVTGAGEHWTHSSSQGGKSDDQEDLWESDWSFT